MPHMSVWSAKMGRILCASGRWVTWACGESWIDSRTPSAEDITATSLKLSPDHFLPSFGSKYGTHCALVQRPCSFKFPFSLEYLPFCVCCLAVSQSYNLKLVSLRWRLISPQIKHLSSLAKSRVVVHSRNRNSGVKQQGKRPQSATIWGARDKYIAACKRIADIAKVCLLWK